MPNSSTFLHIENQAHGGAFGHNPTPTPTEAQCRAGNYKMGRVTLYGINIAIEQPRGTYRTGTDSKTGKRWTNRMAAHYGYFSGTVGNDGDGVDCFVGFYPQSEFAYVINQNMGGRFDEHKVMLAFPDEETARRAYTDSYDRGWPGLASVVPASISQLKWWLKHGNMTRPLKSDHLPHEGLEAMTIRSTQWNADALPYDQTLDQLLYDIRRSDADSLLLDSASIAAILEDSDGALAFDALVVPFAALERRMGVMQRVMERNSQSVKPLTLQVTEPFMQRGVANVAAFWELTDGQTISIYFHNPHVTPKKIMGADEVISWKWLLNRKDITIVVAPERGTDLNINEVARRIMKLAEKNSAAFMRANGKRAERLAAIGGLKTEISALEAELKTALNDLEVAKIEQEDRVAKGVEVAQEKAKFYVAKFDERFRVTSVKNGNPVSPSYPNEAEAEAAMSLHPDYPAPSDAIADISYHQDGMFTTFLANTKAGEKVWREMAAQDDGTGKVLNTHAADVIRQIRNKGYTVSAEGKSNITGAEEDALLAELSPATPVNPDVATTEQGLIDAYTKAWGTEAVKINAAVADVNWGGITDFTSSRVEAGKLHAAFLVAKDIEPARNSLRAIGIDSWDKRLSFIIESPEFKAQGAAVSGYQSALEKIQALAKEASIKIGKTELAALPPDALVETYAQAIYKKNGIDMGDRGDYTGGLVEALKSKSVNYLRDVIGNTGNKASREIFERYTSVKLAKTKAGSLAQVDVWAGISPDQRATMDANKDAAYQEKELADAIKRNWDSLGNLSVTGEDNSLMDGKQWVLSRVAAGHSEVGTVKRGAVPVYGLINAKGALSYFKNTNLTSFLKFAKQYGSLKQVLDLVGAVVPESVVQADKNIIAKDVFGVDVTFDKARHNKASVPTSILIPVDVKGVPHGDFYAIELSILRAEGQSSIYRPDGSIVLEKNKTGQGDMGGDADAFRTYSATPKGMTEDQFSVAKYKQMRLDLNNGVTKPAKIVGGGYKNARKVAEKWIDGRIAEYEGKVAGSAPTDLAEQTPAAKVDAAYAFASATDEFKIWVAESVERDDYSPFATAKAMDIKAKELRGSIDWAVSAAVLDSVSEAEYTDEPLVDENEMGGTFEAEYIDLSDEDGFDFDSEDEFLSVPDLSENDEEIEATLDGDFKGHPFRGNQFKKASRESGTAVNTSIRAKRAERTGSAKDANKAHTTAHYAHMAAGVSATGKAKKYHRIMAKFHGQRAGLTLDSVEGDAAGYETAIGTIRAKGEIAGRAHIGGDGKAMVYMGVEGLTRVVFEDGTKAVWSDTDAPGMVSLLLSAKDVEATKVTLVMPYKFSSATPEALVLLGEAYTGNQPENAYASAAKIETLADRDGLSVAWDAIDSLPILDSLFPGIGSDGYLKGTVKSDSKIVMTVSLRGDGAMAFDISERDTQYKDAGTEDEDGEELEDFNHWVYDPSGAMKWASEMVYSFLSDPESEKWSEEADRKREADEASKKSKQQDALAAAEKFGSTKLGFLGAVASGQESKDAMARQPVGSFTLAVGRNWDAGGGPENIIYGFVMYARQKLNKSGRGIDPAGKIGNLQASITLGTPKQAYDAGVAALVKAGGLVLGNPSEPIDTPTKYASNVVSVYSTRSGKEAIVIKTATNNNNKTYSYSGAYGAGSGLNYASMLKDVAVSKQSHRDMTLTYGVEFADLDPTVPIEIPVPIGPVPAPAPTPTEAPQMTADKALFQSVINNTVPDILAMELGDQLEAAYYRHVGNTEMEALFEAAVNAYTEAELAASANL